MAKYTKGPWRINKRSQFTVETLDGRSIATTGGYYDNKRVNEVHEENTANARIIAASPEMYGVLNELLTKRDFTSIMPQSAERIEKLIKSIGGMNSVTTQ